MNPKPISEALAISFSEEDVANFSYASHDTNPLHMNEEYARKTAYGKRVIFGVVGGLACLEQLPSKRNKSLRQLDIEFQNPIFIDGNYTLHTTNPDTDEPMVELRDGNQVLVRLRATFGPTPKLATAVKPKETTPTNLDIRETPMDYDLEAFEQALQRTGYYQVRPTQQIGKKKKSVVSKKVSPLHLEILMLCSYLIGMEMPGKKALFSKLHLVFDPQKKSKTHQMLRYQATKQHYDATYGLLSVGLEVFNASGRVVSGELKAFVRKAIAPASLETIQNLLSVPKSFFTDKVALITGGSRGLGATMVQALALQGCHVVVNFHSSVNEAKALQESLQSVAGEVVLLQGDASQPEWCEEAKQLILDQYGRLDFLICNACAPPLALGSSAKSFEEMQQYITKNLALVTTPMATFLETLEQNHGALVGISSSIVEIDTKEWPQYKSMKQTMEGLVRTAADSFPNTSCLIVRPPGLLTDMSNTPIRSVGALPPGVVGVAAINALAHPEVAKQVVVLNQFDTPEKELEQPKSSEATKPADEKIVIAATFTADPIQPVMDFWKNTLEFSLETQMAPYKQVFQELLSPQSGFQTNRKGMNAILFRFDDWLKDRKNAEGQITVQENTEFLKGILNDLIDALGSYNLHAPCHTVFMLCPPSERFATEEWQVVFQPLEEELFQVISGLSNVDGVKATSHHDLYQIEGNILDPVRDEIGHIPFTADYFNVLGTLLMRRFYGQKRNPSKVIILDCDNTLWGGVCGEAGPTGVDTSGAFERFHQFLVKQQQQGMLLCLCSKNVDEDVWNVFEAQPNMPLKRKHIVDTRINWQPKSSNIISLAKSLNLGLDSFIFIDDNPVECAEVRANCPQVVTLQWPQTPEAMDQLMQHLWIFDHFQVTAEDKKRTEMYKANLERDQFQANTGDFENFIQSLGLEIDLHPMKPEELPRVAQLTQRTNQFNFTTIRRSPSDVQQILDEQTHECWTATVRDRFGEYGLVGTLLVQKDLEQLTLDSFILSCRVLGRGVEHAMLSKMGEIAKEQNRSDLKVLWKPTAKNKPAQLFLENFRPADHTHEDGSLEWIFTTEELLKISYKPPKQDIAIKKKIKTDKSAVKGAEAIRTMEHQLVQITEFGTLQALSAAVAPATKKTSVAKPISKKKAKEVQGGLYPLVIEDVKTVFAETLSFDKEDLDPEADMEEYAIDSFKIVELTVELKKYFENIPATFLFEHTSLKSIANEVIRTNKDALLEKYADSLAEENSLDIADFTSDEENTLEELSESTEGIAIIGINGKYPQADSLETFWENLKAGKTSITEVPENRWDVEAFYNPEGELGKSYCKRGGFLSDVDCFEAAFFRISPKEAELMDPQQRLFLEVVWGLLEDAGYTKKSIDRQTGVFVGVNANDYSVYTSEAALNGIGAYRNADYYQIPNRISYFFDFQGPSICLDTACSASGTSLYLACESLKKGQTKTAIAAGINLFLHPSRFVQYSQMQMISNRSECQPFGAGADGTVFGEGVGALLLKPLKAAQEDGDGIYGVIKGGAINSGGKTNGFTVPNPQAQAALVSQALKEAQIDPRTISYVEAHGTGTPLGDPIEVRGLTMAYEENFKDHPPATQYCAIGALKANVGHMEAGAAIPGIIKILFQMKHRTLVPSLNSAKTNPSIPFETSPFYVQQDLCEWKRPVLEVNGDTKTFPLRAGISTFGAGGSNAHFIIEEYVAPQRDVVEQAEHPQLIVLSAQSLERLKVQANNLVHFLTDNPQRIPETQRPLPHLSDIAYSLQIGREAMEARLAVVVSDKASLIETLTQWSQLPEEELIGESGTLAGGFWGIVPPGKPKKMKNPTAVTSDNFMEIAKAWVSGESIRWEFLHAPLANSPNRPHRTPLPTYPFAGERYWVPEFSTLSQKGKSAAVHPLIDQIDASQSLDHGVVFQKRFKPTDPILRDHQVHHQPILPGVGYLEMAYATLAQIQKGAHYHLTQALWLQPLAVQGGEKEAWVVLKEENSKISYEIKSNDPNQKLPYAKGVFTLAEMSDELSEQYVSIEAIQARCLRQMRPEAIYSQFQASGFNYGPYFRGVQNVFLSDEEALGVLEVASANENELSQYTLHPTLADGAFQTTLCLSGPTENPLLPFALESMEVLHPLTKQTYAYVRKTGERRFQIALLNEDGLVCVKFHNFTLRMAKDALHRFFYTTQWKPAPLITQASAPLPTSNSGKTVLIVHSPQALGVPQALAEQHVQDRVVQVQLDQATTQLSEIQWKVDVRDTSALGTLLERFPSIQCIYFLGGLATEPVDLTDLDALEKHQAQGVFSFFRLVKALTSRKPFPKGLELKIVTNGVYSSDSATSQGTQNPYAASLLGLAKVVAKEYSQLKVACLDLQLPSTSTNLSQQDYQKWVVPILAEPASHGNVVLIENGQRYAQSIEPCSLSAQQDMPLKRHGVYLILGGAGGIGRTFSQYLAKHVQARLVWLGRSALNDDQKASIAEIEALGGQVLYLQADATHLESMQQAIAQAKSQFGPIQGVVHAAIALHDKILANMDEAMFNTALAPKTQGSVVLHQLLKNEPLDFMVFFSSIDSFITPMGQSNYVAGCSFKDAYAKAINQTQPYPVTTVNWGFWGSVGVATSEEDHERFARKGLLPIQPDEGMEAIRRILTNPMDQVLAFKATETQLEKMGTTLSTAQSTTVEHVPPIENKSSQPVSPVLATPSVPVAASQPTAAPINETVLQKKIMDYVIQGFVDVLGIKKSTVDPKSTFDRYGVDSLLSMQIIQFYENDLGSLSSTLLFENITVEELTEYFLENHQEDLEKKLGIDKQSNVSKVDQLFQTEPAPQPAADIAFSQTLVPSTPAPVSVTAKTNNLSYEQDIAIIGVSGRYPQSNTIDELWENLKQGHSCTGEIPKERWDSDQHYDPAEGRDGKSRSKWGGFIQDVDKFDSLFFNISPKEAVAMDPQERLFLETAWQTFEDAGYTFRSLEDLQERYDSEVGVFIGCMYHQYPFVSTDPTVGAMASTSSYWYIANRISYFFNFHGPSLAIDTACSSSLTSIHMACESLRLGNCVLALAGGVNLNLHPAKYLRLDQVGMLASSEASKSLGDGDGLVPGEGIGAVLLKPLSLAIQDNDSIHGVIKTSFINHDGKTGGFMTPNPKAHTDLIGKALNRANINPRTITYMEAAANGSALGDPIEIAGLNKAFLKYTKDKQYCAVGSVKSNLGHLEAASGVAQLTKVLLQMKHRTLVPSLNASPLNPKLRLEDTPFYLQDQLTSWERPKVEESGELIEYPRRAAISSFGAGGANAHIVVEEYEAPSLPNMEEALTESPQIIVFSAKNEDRVKSYAKKLLGFLHKHLGLESSQGAHSPQVLEKLQQTLRSFLVELLQVNATDVELDQSFEELGVDPILFSKWAEQINQHFQLDMSPTALYEQPHLLSTAKDLYQTYPEHFDLFYQDVLEMFANPSEEHSSLNLRDIAYTLQVGREAMKERVALVASTPEELVEQLELYCQGKESDALYRGNSSGSQTIGLLVDGEEGAMFLNQIISNQKYDKLAQLWVGGVEFDWQLLYPSVPNVPEPKRISLPTYSFARKRYWPNANIANSKPSEGVPQEVKMAGPIKPPVAAAPLMPERKIPIPTTPAVEIKYQENIQNNIMTMISNLLDVPMEDIELDVDIRDYGFDSVQLMELAKQINEHFDLEITTDLFFSFPTLELCVKELWGEYEAKLTQHYQKEQTATPVAAPAQPMEESTVFSEALESSGRPDIQIKEDFLVTPKFDQTPIAALGLETPPPLPRPLVRQSETTLAEPPNTPIAIVGMSGMMPQSEDLDAFWENLIDGKEMITTIPKERWDWAPDDQQSNLQSKTMRWGGYLSDIDKFDSLFFGISPKEAASIDPQQRLFLETAWKTIENAGYDPVEFAGTDTGVFVGVSGRDYAQLMQKMNVQSTAHTSTGSMVTSILANRVSYLLDLHGPSEIVDTACSSSTVALHRAIRSIQSGECRMAIAGGVNLVLDPEGSETLDQAGILSHDGKIRMFNESGSGYVRGEGVGAVLLKPLSQAEADRDHIYAVVKGSALNYDGKSYSLTAPNPKSQAEVILKAYEQANIDPASISYIEAQGTGSPLGDPVEINALKKAFGVLRERWGTAATDYPVCGVGYLKPTIGHLECASGIAALIKVLLSLKHNQLPAVKNVAPHDASNHFKNSPFYLVDKNQPWVPPIDQKGNYAPRCAGIHSFGFGGVNAHIVLEEYSG